MGIKPSDYLCVPLTAELHSQLHHEGERSFYARHKVDIESVIKMNLLIYAAGHENISYLDMISLVEKT